VFTYLLAKLGPAPTLEQIILWVLFRALWPCAISSELVSFVALGDRAFCPAGLFLRDWTRPSISRSS